MNNLYKQYIKNAKTFFPIMGKNEKQYFKNLELHIKDYCEETSTSTLEELYNNFGKPSDVANTYFSSVNTDYVIKQIKRTKVIKAFLITLMISALITVSVCCSIFYSTYNVFKSEQIYSENTIIE